MGESIQALCDVDPFEAIKLVVEISREGRAPKNDPAIFALAYFSGVGGTAPDERALAVRRAALDALPDVCRTGTHLLHFVEFAEKFRGHGPALNKALARWFTREDVDAVAYQLVKYRSRDAWAQRDVIRLARPKPPTPVHDALFRWAVEQKGEVKGPRSEAYEVHGRKKDDRPRAVEAFERAQAAATARETAALVKEYGGTLPREALNTDHLTSPEVWEALLYAGNGMPLTALIRNLATMTRIGLLAPFSPHIAEVTRRITDPESLRRARVHPLAVLAALTTYQEGQGSRGTSTWQPLPQIVDALDASFYASFGNVEPSGKRILLAIDVSGSMDGMAYGVPPRWIVNGKACVNGVPGLTPRIAAAAMALVTAAVEPHCFVLAFSDRLVPLEISPRERLDAVVRKMRSIPMGGTDCALPMLWAQGIQAVQNRRGYRSELVGGGSRVPIDGFVVYTDNETWAGGLHPAQALRQYRERTGIPARSVVVGMVANGFSIADPKDPGMLDVVGFDSAAPQVISDFVARKL